MTPAVERGSAAGLTRDDTATGDKRALAAFGRTAEFWRRASGIYLAYKAAQVRMSLRAGAKPEQRAEFWQKHHTWAGKEMYKLCIDLRGFYLKASCVQHAVLALIFKSARNQHQVLTEGCSRY